MAASQRQHLNGSITTSFHAWTSAPQAPGDSDQWMEGPHIGAVSIPSPTLTVYTKVLLSIELEPSPPALGEALEACETKALN